MDLCYHSHTMPRHTRMRHSLHNHLIDLLMEQSPSCLSLNLWSGFNFCMEPCWIMMWRSQKMVNIKLFNAFFTIKLKYFEYLKTQVNRRNHRQLVKLNFSAQWTWMIMKLWSRMSYNLNHIANTWQPQIGYKMFKSTLECWTVSSLLTHSHERNEIINKKGCRNV